MKTIVRWLLLSTLLVHVACLSTSKSYKQIQKSLKAKQYTRAEKLIQSAIRTYPFELELYDKLAFVYKQQKRYKAGSLYFSKLLERPSISKKWWIRNRVQEHRASLQKGETQDAESLLYQKITSSLDASSIARYLKRYPKGIYRSHVQDAALFRSAREERSIGALRLYIKQYPDGLYVAQARTLLQRIRKQQQTKKSQKTPPTIRKGVEKKKVQRKRAFRRIRQTYYSRCKRGSTRRCLQYLIHLKSLKIPESTHTAQDALQRSHSFLRLAKAEKQRRIKKKGRPKARKGTTLFLSWTVLRLYSKSIAQLKENASSGTKKRYFRLKICCLRPPYQLSCTDYSRIGFRQARSCEDIKKKLQKKPSLLAEDYSICKRFNYPQASISSCIRMK